MKLFADLTRFRGNTSLFDAVETAITATTAGIPMHLHAQGLRGLGKTTILRAAAQVMPTITRVKGCPYNCDPTKPHCPLHQAVSAEQLKMLGTEEIAMPFLEISHSAKIGTVAGSIDLGKLVDPNHPEAALLPGIIPRAHRGVIFIDEINRLADTAPEITDILLDVMGTKPGKVQIEETGFSPINLEIRVSVWAASNPDEDPGPLQDVRKQLSDRFDLVVDMGRPDKAETVSEILRQRTNFSHRTAGTSQLGKQLDNQLRQRIAGAAKRLPEVLVPDAVNQLIAEVYVRFGLESLRAVESLALAAQLWAALQLRHRVEIMDLTHVLPWVLNHRLPVEQIQQIREYIANPFQKRSETDVERPLPRRAKGITELLAADAIADERKL